VETFIVGNAVFFQFSVSGTATPVTGASFSFGEPGINSAPALYVVPSIPPVNDEGAVEQDGSFVVTPETIEWLLAGGVYLVVSTVEYPDGELRGQVVAAQVGVTFPLSPDNEVPAVTTSTASGSLSMYRYMDGDNLAAVLYNLVIDDAVASPDVTKVHFHAGAAGANGDLIFNFPIDPFTVFSGITSQHTGIISDDASLAIISANLNAMYMNVHTAANPSGELRGQIDYSEYDAAMAAEDEANDASKKPKAKPIVPVVVTLNEQSLAVNGWYDNAGGVDTFADTFGRRLEESGTTFPVPHILTYPKYTIANEFNTKLITSGSMCIQNGARAAEERCEEKLPANGKFIFRATGWVPEGDKDTWTFCGVTGKVGQELQFEMVKGKCVPGQLIDAADLCADGGSVISIIGQAEFTDVVTEELSHYDALVFENEIAEMMGSVLSVSVDSYKQTASGLLVTFGVTVAAERYNVDATVVDNIAPLIATLQSSLNRKLVNNLYMTSASKVTAAGYPRSSLLDATHANLVSFTYVGVKYLAPLPADKVVSYPAYNKDPSSKESSSEDKTVSAFPVATVAAVFGVAVVVAFVAMKTREFGAAGAKFEALPTASEHTVELSEDKLSAFDLGMETAGQETL
jgi:hypothetical protein